MKLNYTATPSIISPTSFRLEITEFTEDSIGGALYDTYKRYSTAVIDTREKAIREGLIALGWTPPLEESNK